MFFLVDTIQFEDPVVVLYDRASFICEDSGINKKKIKTKHFDSNFYVLGFDIFGKGVITWKDITEILRNEILCHDVPPTTNTFEKNISKDITLFKFNEIPDFFILAIYPVHAS